MNSFVRKFSFLLATFSFLAVSRGLIAEVTLPSLWSDHVVIQRELPVHVWGWAAAGEQITVHFRDAAASATTDKLGRWDLYLPPGKAGGPFTMEIQGNNTIDLSDILVGDVWVASGQSNMEFETKLSLHADEELKAAQQPNIHLFHVEHKSSDFPQEDVTTKAWVPCTPESVADFSAVAYFFGRDIQDDQHVPIGLIEASWGGTPAEAWTSQTALSATDALLPAWQTWGKLSEREPVAARERNWEDRERKAAVAAGKPEPKFLWHPELRSWLPGGLFNGMIAPLVPFPIRGVIWYQGESNTGAERYFYYNQLFSALISDWRERWAEGDFPFLFVQIANWTPAPDSKWPELREAQRKTLNIDHTGMAVAIDIGDPNNIHPKNKQEVGRRLSLAARALAYHEQLEFSGPLYRTKMREGASMRVFFDHETSGLIAKDGVLTGFEIADADGKFVPAEARIDGESVVVSSPLVKEPTAVHYGWSGNPQCSLYNKDGLPASPFTTQ